MLTREQREHLRRERDRRLRERFNLVSVDYWLRCQLEGGQRSEAELLQEAAAVGISRTGARKAGERLGVRRRRGVWLLPEHLDEDAS